MLEFIICSDVDDDKAGRLGSSVDGGRGYILYSVAEYMVFRDVVNSPISVAIYESEKFFPTLLYPITNKSKRLLQFAVKLPVVVAGSLKSLRRVRQYVKQFKQTNLAFKWKCSHQVFIIFVFVHM